MSVLAERWLSPLGDCSQVRAVLAALGVCVGGFVAAFIGILALSIVLPPAVTSTDAFRVVSGNKFQVGLAVFAVIYLRRRQNLDRFIKIRRPTLEDLIWIVVLPPIVFIIVETIVTPGLAALGLPHPMPGGGGDGIDLANRPALWPIVFVCLYMFAAPAEELVYRGIVHGQLREAFTMTGVVLFGAVMFGLLHFIVGILTPAVSLAASLNWGIGALVPGLLWGYAYERTENLLVPSVMHAMSWTIPFHALIPIM
jgi:membrane protease YdiL (CAAX protease family)